ncbi:MAG: cysteine desulfurase [Ruminococcaceae bacterium]|nr:cysteine desulfurase [Oscillospiraceae bacterium]
MDKGISTKNKKIYLDNAATTKISKESLRAMREVSEEYYANPSSLYASGINSRKLIENSRKTVAEALGCEPDEFVFTSSGTESNNIAVLGSYLARKNFGENIVVTGYEHPSVYETMRFLEKEGVEIRWINPDSSGTVNVNSILESVDKKTALVSAMHTNNEIGSVLDVEKIAKRVKSINSRTAVHCDFVQGFLKQSIEIKYLDIVSISGHKVHGPKNVGGLYKKKNLNFFSTVFGGSQEGGVRSGTENLILIPAFSAAVSCYDTEKNAIHARLLNDELRKGLRELGGIVINSPEDASPFILNFSVPGYNSETLMRYLDENGIEISAGSACSGIKDSSTLTAMGLHRDIIKSSLRAGFSLENSTEDIEYLLSLIEGARKKLTPSRRGR